MKLYQKIVLILFVPILFFVALECFLRISPWNRILGPERFYGGLEDHSLFWSPDNIIKIPIDEYRKNTEFRGRIFSVDKPEGVYRIVCLGGSFTYGWPYNDNPSIAYPAVLEKLLNSSIDFKRKYKKYEVINAGIGGYTTYQALFYFKNRLYKLKPDLVTICFGANDGNNNYEIVVFCSDKEYYEKLIALSHHKTLFKIKNILNSLRVYALIEKVIFNIKKHFVKPKQRVPPQDFENNLEEFIKLGKTYGFKLLFILEPHRNLNAFEEEIKINPYYDIMYRLAKKYPKNVKLVDTVSWARKYKDSEIFYDVMHLTPFGHKRLAELIYRRIKEAGYIK